MATALADRALGAIVGSAVADAAGDIVSHNVVLCCPKGKVHLKIIKLYLFSYLCKHEWRPPGVTFNFSRLKELDASFCVVRRK